MTLCPVKHCNQPVQRDALACRSHWGMVPKAIREEFNRACRRAPGTPTHVEAVSTVQAYLARRAC